ncbi:MAG TPA: antibiotic biosynthesis monooxygenase [Acidimicrobiales bacterium]|jgi:hypothetical protein|nr:antibiotic biosynthesis monooxygenase [Acidimicrobiales bacterium]
MAVLAIFTVEGDTAELQDRYDAAMPKIIEVSPGKPLAHVCTTYEGGLRVYDVWESADALDDFAGNPRFAETIAEAGLPEPKVEVVPVHRFNW